MISRSQGEGSEKEMIVKTIKQLFDQLVGQHKFSRTHKIAGQASPQMMISMIMDTQEDDIDCDATFELMNQYAEMLLRGEDVAQILPKVHRHIQSCPDCLEELEALLRTLSEDPDLILKASV